MPNQTDFGRLGIVVTFAGLLAVGACSSSQDNTVSTPPPVPATAQPETVVGEAYVATEATIAGIDARARTVTLRMADGRMQTVAVPADADLTERKTGEVVILEAFERVSVRALPSGSASLGVSQQVASTRTPQGETPHRAAGQRTAVISEVAAINIASNSVTLRSADGELQTIDVRNPENQRKLQTLNVGDLVEIVVIEAAGVRLKSKA